MNEAAIEWLGKWEPIQAPGRHASRYPANFAHGYTFFPGCRIDKRPRPMEDIRERIIRAIPVEGSVSEPAPSWQKSPQVRFWMEEAKPNLGARLRAWLRRAA